MSKLIWIKSRRRPIPVFEEAIAGLHEELALTENFAEAMVRGGNYKAAAGVIDEQQRRLAAHRAAMERGFAPAARRIQIAGSFAAAMLLGTISLALAGLHSEPQKQSALEVMHSVERTIERATTTRTGAEASRYANAALGELSALGNRAIDPNNPIDLSLLQKETADLQQQLRALLQAHPEMRGLIRKLLDATRVTKVKIDPNQVAPPSSPPSSSPSASASPQASPATGTSSPTAPSPPPAP